MYYTTDNARIKQQNPFTKNGPELTLTLQIVVKCSIIHYNKYACTDIFNRVYSSRT